MAPFRLPISTPRGSHFHRTPQQSVRPQVDPQSQWFTMPPQMHLCSKLWKSLTTFLQYLHDHSLAGHFGQTKTLHQVHMQYYWSGLLVYIKDYCKSCTTCSHAKPVRHKPTDFSSNFRFLRSLGIPYPCI